MSRIGIFPDLGLTRVADYVQNRLENHWLAAGLPRLDRTVSPPSVVFQSGGATLPGFTNDFLILLSLAVSPGRASAPHLCRQDPLVVPLVFRL